MWTTLSQFALSLVARAQLQREEGQALVEYGLILGLVAVVVIGALAIIGTEVDKVFVKIGEELTKAL